MAKSLQVEALTAYLQPLLEKHEKGTELVHEDLIASWHAVEDLLSESTDASAGAVNELFSLHKSQLVAYRESALHALQEWASSWPLPPVPAALTTTTTDATTTAAASGGGGGGGDGNTTIAAAVVDAYTQLCLAKAAQQRPGWKIGTGLYEKTVYKIIRERASSAAASAAAAAAAAVATSAAATAAATSLTTMEQPEKKRTAEMVAAASEPSQQQQQQQQPPEKRQKQEYQQQQQQPPPEKKIKQETQEEEEEGEIEEGDGDKESQVGGGAAAAAGEENGDEDGEIDEDNDEGTTASGVQVVDAPEADKTEASTTAGGNNNNNNKSRMVKRSVAKKRPLPVTGRKMKSQVTKQQQTAKGTAGRKKVAPGAATGRVQRGGRSGNLSNK